MNAPSFTREPTNWLDTIKVNLPDHASDLEAQLTWVMASSDLTEEEAHGAALAAAAASGNGELAFEISMNSPLFGSDIRESIIQIVLHQAVNSTFSTFVDCAKRHTLYPTALVPDGFTGENHKAYNGLTPEQNYLFSLAAAVVNKSEHQLSQTILFLRRLNVPREKMEAVARIASVVSTLTKVVL